jgi:hypothetical protein
VPFPIPKIFQTVEIQFIKKIKNQFSSSGIDEVEDDNYL